MAAFGALIFQNTKGEGESDAVLILSRIASDVNQFIFEYIAYSKLRSNRLSSVIFSVVILNTLSTADAPVADETASAIPAGAVELRLIKIFRRNGKTEGVCQMKLNGFSAE